jgi:glycosyltransferase involved in cell wall biosynthesis
MYIKVHEKGTELAFIAGQSSGARAKSMKLPPYENMDGVPVYRLYKNSNEMLIFPRRRLKEVLEIAKQLNPDLILCHLADNMRLALLLQRHLKIPIVLHVEIASWYLSRRFVDSWKMRTVRRLLGMPTRGPRLWSWLCEKADALITSHPPDRKILNLLSEHGKPVYYLPWPAQVPEGCKLPPTRDRYRGIYAGLLIPFKNTQEFEWILPLILQKTPTKEFVVIGAGAHAVIIKRLQQKFGNAIKYIPRLKTRCDVINFIASSYYAFTPVKEGGWGFLGDCWGTGTPLLMLHNVFVSKKLSASVAKNGDDLVRKINRLYEDREFYQKLQNIGYDAYRMRTAEAIGDKLYEIFLKTLEQTQVHT